MTRGATRAARKATFLLALVVSLLAGCDRERRSVRPEPATAGPAVTAPSVPLAAGPRPIEPWPTPSIDYRANAYAMSQGKRLFSWYNCVGCHANGGGGMGPPLMDDDWIYGQRPEQIFASIAEGRPNGMPSFGTRVSTDQIWQIAAYVDSLSGRARTDAAPGRSDSMSTGEPELLRSPREYGKEEGEE